MPTLAYSLAVCTYNRATKLRRLLGSIEGALRQTTQGAWEVLVVDNNSSDFTQDICRKYADRIPLIYIFEGEQGLSNARNRAISECSGNLLLFTDDDVIVNENWLRAYEEGSGEYAAASYFGGRVLPLWETPRPSWLKDERMPLLGGLFVHYDLGESSQWLGDEDPNPFGASFAIRRDLFDRVGLFRRDLGVNGEVPGRGEEAEYLARARAAGFRGAYLAEAVCHHPVEPDRLSIGYLYRYGVQKGIAEARMRQHPGPGSIVNELMYGVRGLTQLVRGRGDRFRQCVINMGIQRGLRC